MTTSQSGRSRTSSVTPIKRSSSSSSNGRRPAKRVSAGAAAKRAREEFAELTQTPVERVTGVQRSDSGWVVTLEGLELRRIPETMDVLGVYQVELSASGQVKGWTRVARCYRSQVEDA